MKGPSQKGRVEWQWNTTRKLIKHARFRSQGAVNAPSEEKMREYLEMSQLESSDGNRDVTDIWMVATALRTGLQKIVRKALRRRSRCGPTRMGRKNRVAVTRNDR